MDWSRRAFLGACAAAGVSAWALEDPFAQMSAIAARIRPPRFPARDFEITRFGARPDALATEAIAKTIAACHRAGGGRVVVPPGVFLTGPVHLRSNVNLFLSAGATLRFSPNPEHYLPAVHTRWEGVELMGYSPLIYAFQQTNIAVTGAGTLDGQASPECWWPWKGQQRHGWKQGEPHQAKARQDLFAMAERDVPVSERRFAEGSYLRPQFLQPYRCTNVLIEGVTICNSPMWEIHPVLCRNVTVRGVTVVTHGPNNDGCDPESCSDVLIENCLFDTGDDCIAIKSGRNRDGRRLARPSENIIVRGCSMKDGHGGVTIGSEMSGGVRNVFVEDCQMDSPNLDRALRIKTNSYRGGTVENVCMRNITVGEVADAVFHADFYYEEGEGGPHLPAVSNILLRNVTCRKAKYALYLRGFGNDPIRGVRLERCAFTGVERGSVLENVSGLTLDGVSLNGKPWLRS